MAFTSYLTYEEYTSLGGTVSEDAFPIYERKAQRQLDYITFNRIKFCTIVPDEVKEVLTEFINTLHSFAEASGDTPTVNVSSYSNGVEKFTFEQDADKQLNKTLVSIAYRWLPEYLIARSVKFDVEKYLQSENNNP